ncbi:MAG: putative iron-regulated protein [Bacteroidia bacterium]|jgi:uncharacterized iron-regulated protein
MIFEKAIITLLVVVVVYSASAQNKSAYKIYNAKGKSVSYPSMLKAMSKEDVVLFGEQHNNAIAHWLQLELTKDLNKVAKLQLGAEMIETDNQEALNLYLSDSISYKQFDSMARLWNNYKTDYAPLVDFAKDSSLPFTASNIPRRYASIVYRGGFEALDTFSDAEKTYMASLPIPFNPELPQYQAILKMMGEHGSPRLVMAQAIKDATMAQFILAAWNEGSIFIHFNGAFHSDFYEGIFWYLKQSNPSLKIGTISTVTQADVSKLEKEHLGKADFIICVDEDVTTTY